MDLVSSLMAYKIADLVDVCARCGILDALDGPVMDVDALCHDLHLQPEFLQIVLRFGERFDLFARNDQGYTLTEIAQKQLPLIKLELWARRWHQENDSLYQVLTTGARCDPMISDVGDARPAYELAMSEAARLIALNIGRIPRLDGTRVVDLGGSDGALGQALLRYQTARRVIVCDRPSARPGFEDRSARSEHGYEFTFIAVDLQHPDSLACALDGATLVLMSNVIHLLNVEERKGAYQAIRKYGAPNVTLVIYDQFASSDFGAELNMPTLMVLDWLKCGVPFDYSAADIGAEVHSFGFDIVLRQAFGLSGSLVIAQSQI